MDWIDAQLLKMKDKLMKQSLRKTLSIYIIIATVSVIFMYVITVVFCKGWMNLVYTKYSIDTHSYIPIQVLVKLELIDKVILYGAYYVKTYSILIYSIVAIPIISNVFYKNTLRIPIEILKEEASHISRNDLSFCCIYNSGNELGEICKLFDDMRIQLIKSNENIWSLMEGQRQLNSTFAHDIRTPLTVMQGYTDLLFKYYPQGLISEEKLLDTLSLMQSQLSRLKEFSEKMKDIQDINSIKINQSITDFNLLKKRITDIANGINVESKFQINITDNLKDHRGYVDENIILQVIDNLLSNAISFARSNIDILLQIEDDFLYIYIRDDGDGFSKKELYFAQNPYYSNRIGIDGHYGLGLSICKILCEKHGGKLTLNNSTKGGAIICASFFSVVDKK